MSKEVEVMEVVCTRLLRRGRGVQGSPIRIITQYWSKEGELLAEVDPCPEEELYEERAKKLSGAV